MPMPKNESKMVYFLSVPEEHPVLFKEETWTNIFVGKFKDRAIPHFSVRLFLQQNSATTGKVACCK